MKVTRPLIIGTRGSRLALWQSRHIAAALHGLGVQDVQLRVIKTSGDRLQDRHPGQMSIKGIFVKEIEDALLDEKVDLAVHSTKDLPGELPPGLTLAAHPARVDPRDALVTEHGSVLDDLPPGAILGTVSLRRRSQLLARRPDLRFTDMRGNVDTRLRKLEAGEVDGLVLALAGLQRLELVDDRCWPIPVDLCLPAPAQGVLGIECRAADQDLVDLLGQLDDKVARLEAMAERTILTELDAGCLVPLAALARIDDGEMNVEGLVASPDGSEIIRERRSGPASAAHDLGLEVAAALKERGAEALLEAARRVSSQSPSVVVDRASNRTQPLQDLQVVVTRPQGQASELVGLLERAGAHAVVISTSLIEPVADKSQIDATMDHLSDYSWILFTSANGVRVYLDRLQERGMDEKCVSWPQVAAIGPATAEALARRGISVDLIAEQHSAEGLLESMPEDLNGQRILIPRARIARPLLPDTLRRRGAQVDVLVVYQTLPAMDDVTDLQKQIEGGAIAAVTFASASAVQNFAGLFPPGEMARLLLRNDVAIACIGPITAGTVAEMDLEVQVTAPEATFPCLVAALSDYFAAP